MASRGSASLRGNPYSGREDAVGEPPSPRCPRSPCYRSAHHPAEVCHEHARVLPDGLVEGSAGTPRGVDVVGSLWQLEARRSDGVEVTSEVIEDVEPDGDRLGGRRSWPISTSNMRCPAGRRARLISASVALRSSTWSREFSDVTMSKWASGNGMRSDGATTYRIACRSVPSSRYASASGSSPTRSAASVAHSRLPLGPHPMSSMRYPA